MGPFRVLPRTHDHDGHSPCAGGVEVEDVPVEEGHEERRELLLQVPQVHQERDTRDVEEGLPEEVGEDVLDGSDLRDVSTPDSEYTFPSEGRLGALVVPAEVGGGWGATVERGNRYTGHGSTGRVPSPVGGWGSLPRVPTGTRRGGSGTHEWAAIGDFPSSCPSLFCNRCLTTIWSFSTGSRRSPYDFGSSWAYRYAFQSKTRRTMCNYRSPTDEVRASHRT